jgi:ribonuclease E
MPKKMLIDATHAEETRVVVIEGNKVDEFDFETVTKRQIAGNIYLAKVTRVEPSLQAAFVDYGGNRHGFLAFSEIHPDYYQIPLEDRKKLIEEEAALERAEAEADGALVEEEEKPKPKRRRSSKAKPAEEAASEKMDASNDDATKSEDVPAENADDTKDDDAGTTMAESAGASDEDDVISSDEVEDDGSLLVETPESDAPAKKPRKRRKAPAKKAKKDEGDDSDTDAEDTPDATAEDAPAPKKTRARRRRKKSDDADEADAKSADADPASNIESVAAESVEEEFVRKKPRQRRFKIQEVIRVRQILLVQVVKEERGNKGAALTTYLSLAGRYCVLMPNTARGGGISRKITNPSDRKKLKEIAGEIEVPEGAGLIVRTAGARRTRTEIKRDYEYLLRLWEQIRDLTLSSIAPKLIYEEGNLIKRSIRDLYSREIDEVIVAGDAGHAEAKAYMKMLLPSHAKNVKLYQDTMPLFSRYQVENYLGGMMNPTVQLKSGGYIVIGITEALVAVDVNSGRATKEGSIEETALKTNLEAATEIARQMRLRDLAGLLVIDFIDMEERRNNIAVEKRLKDALKTDRARIQVGRISGFGLLEMSRQRLRPGMLEATTTQCPHCYGTGYIRSDENLALAIMRELDEEGMRSRSKEVLVKVPIDIANYMLNAKREHVALIESRYGLSVRVEADPSLVGSQYNVERFKTATRNVVQTVEHSAITSNTVQLDDIEVAEEPEQARVNDDDQPKRKRRRRRRGGRNRNRDNDQNRENSHASEAGDDAPDTGNVAEEVKGEKATSDPNQDAPEEAKKPRARRSRKPKDADAGGEQSAQAEPAPQEDEKPKRKRAPRKAKADAEAPAEDAPEAKSTDDADEKPQKAPRKRTAKTKEKAEEVQEATPAPAPKPEPAPEPKPAPEPEAKPEPEPKAKKERKRAGWWSRALGKD